MVRERLMSTGHHRTLGELSEAWGTTSARQSTSLLVEGMPFWV